MKTILCLLTIMLANEPQVSWWDDFLGIHINPIYAISLAGTGNVKISMGRNGVMALYATSSGIGTARVRLGEEPGNSVHNALNFSARKNLRYKARVFLNSAENIKATVGLTGLNDPDNVLALIYREHTGWIFQAINERVSINQPIGFHHQPGRYFTVRIETEWQECRCAKAYIDDVLMGTVSEEYIPDGLVAEFQVWNRPLDVGGYSQPTLYVDYLSITQDR